MPSLTALLGLDASRFQAGLNKAQGMAKSAGGRISSALSGGVTRQLAGIASVAVVAEAGRRTIEYAGHVEDLSDRLGISTEAVQAWDYALGQSGSSIDAAAPFFEKLSRSRNKALAGNKDAIKSFNALGVSLDDLKTKRLEDIGIQISKTIGTGDVQKLMGDLQSVGGRGAGELTSAFKNGFAEAVGSAKELGVVISDDVIAKLDEAGDKFALTSKQFTAQLAPFLAGLSEFISKAWRAGNMAMRYEVGLLTGGGKGAYDLVQEYKQELEAQDKAQEDARTRRKAARKGGGVGDGEDEDTKQKEAEKSAKRVLDLKEDLFKAQQSAAMEAMTKEKQLQELMRRRKAILDYVEANKDKIGEEGRIKAQIDIAEIDKQRVALSKRDDFKRMDANQLQRIGAYVSDPIQTQQLDIQKRSENRLTSIDNNIQRLVAKQTTTSGTQF